MVDMGHFTAVLEVRDGADWAPSAPIPLQGDDGDTPREVGLDFLTESQPEHEEYRLRVWCGRRPNLLAEPAAVVSASDVECSEHRGGHVLRAGRRHHRLRVTGPASAVVERVRLDEVALGSAILVTRDRRNTAASECLGPWYPAAHADGAVRATVKQARHHYVDRHTVGAVDLVLSVGDMTHVRPDRTAPRA